MSSLTLKTIVNVSVYLSPVAAPRKAFNLGLIIGTAAVIPPTERVRIYTETAAMLEDGFLTSDPEYKAALLYFGQKPAPTRLLVGRQVTTAPFTASCSVTSGSAVITPTTMSDIEVGQVVSGTGIAVGSVVTAVGTTTVTLDKVATQSGEAVSLTFTATIETAVDALQACRTANHEWWAFLLCGAPKADVLAMAGEVESMAPTTVQFYTTSDADTLTGTDGNIFKTLKGLSYMRDFGQYSTTTPDAAAAALGYAMGANTGLAGSAFTLCFKNEVGVATESITATQFEKIAGDTGDNGNVYVNRGDFYNVLQSGKMANGTFFDEVLNLDKLANDLQLTGMDALYQLPKIPQTDAGVSYLITRLQEPLETAVKIGFIAPGKWTGPTLLSLNTNDFLSRGYLILSESVNDQAQADREARKAPPIYIPIKLAGAIHSIAIGVYVNR